MTPKLLLHVTCVLGRADDALVAALAAPGKLDHVHIRPEQPERDAEARCAWQWRYKSKGERDDAYERVREAEGLWAMTEDRPDRRR